MRFMISIIVHGGAWNIPDEMVDAHRSGVRKALLKGWEILVKGASALDAVEQTVMVLEDDPTFDAGQGSVMNALGHIELDAGIMNGKTHDAGAVACLQNFSHPISIARKVMEESDHVLLSGVGAARFARENGFKPCPANALIIPRELNRWKDMYARDDLSPKKRNKDTYGDTVGVVAMDTQGIIAVGTSTGGTPHKYPGRIGDSPIIGSGMYADNDVGGVTVSGWGEGIMKVVLAKSVVDLMVRNGGNPQTAAEQGVALLKKKVKGRGGVIALNAAGEIGIAFNTPRMAHGYMTAKMKKPVVAI
jgi:L-asparaginase / beta-aspartyl-peptidase